jgi:hypothetical protein
MTPSTVVELFGASLSLASLLDQLQQPEFEVRLQGVS